MGEGAGLSGPPGRSEHEGQGAPDTTPRAPAGLLCLGSWVLGAPGGLPAGKLPTLAAVLGRWLRAWLLLLAVTLSPMADSGV